MSASTYFDTVANTRTEFEEVFPLYLVEKLRTKYSKNQKCFSLKDVAILCKEYDLTYSQYQQMESHYLSKLQRIFKNK